jgi:hypothetical protein
MEGIMATIKRFALIAKDRLSGKECVVENGPCLYTCVLNALNAVGFNTDENDLHDTIDDSQVKVGENNETCS